MITFSNLTERLNDVNFSWNSIKERIDKFDSIESRANIIDKIVDDRFEKQEEPVSAQQAYQNLRFISQLYDEYKEECEYLILENNYVVLPSKLLIAKNGKKLIVKQRFDFYYDNANASKDNDGYYEIFSPFHCDANTVRHEDNHILNGDCTYRGNPVSKRMYEENWDGEEIEIDWHDKRNTYGQSRESHADIDRPTRKENIIKGVGDDVLSAKERVMNYPNMKHIEPDRYAMNKHLYKHNKSERKLGKYTNEASKNLFKNTFSNLTNRLNKINFSRSNIVYHTCSIDSAIWNIENDCIDAKLRAEKSTLGDNLPVYSDHISPEWKGIKFVSVTTNPDYVIAKQYSNKNGFVRFALDLNKIKQDFEIKDWEFFKSKAYLESIKNKPDAKQKLYQKFGEHDCLEYEKRILGKLCPLSKYLIGVDIFTEKDTKDIDIKLVKLELRRSECSKIEPNIIQIGQESYEPNVGSRFIK